MTQLQAVNLGGWLVIEKWMTPSLFAGTEAIDEYTLSQTPEGRRRIEQHRRQFITEADIVWLKQQGVDMVRVPVGYWLFTEAAPYVSGTTPLDNCVRWCERHGMRLLIDLHGAPGSQNGHDHSGRVGRVRFWRPSAQRQGIAVLQTIAQRYGQSPSLWGVQLLNEPQVGRHVWQLRKWYRRGYDAIDSLLAPGVKIVFSDGFRPRLLNGALRARPRAVMDMHHYQFATMHHCPSRRLLSLYKWRLWRRQRLVERLGRTQPIIVGEWSAVLGHGLLQQERITTKDYQEHYLPWHIAAQRRAFGEAIAMCYWSYRMEVPGEWSMRALVERGVLRYNPNNE